MRPVSRRFTSTEPFRNSGEQGSSALKGSTVLDWDGLKKAGDFDPTYLHLEQEQAAA